MYVCVCVCMMCMCTHVVTINDVYIHACGVCVHICIFTYEFLTLKVILTNFFGLKTRLECVCVYVCVCMCVCIIHHVMCMYMNNCACVCVFDRSLHPHDVYMYIFVHVHVCAGERNEKAVYSWALKFFSHFVEKVNTENIDAFLNKEAGKCVFCVCVLCVCVEQTDKYLAYLRQV
jgi:hypothetical protein